MFNWIFLLISILTFVCVFSGNQYVNAESPEQKQNSAEMGTSKPGVPENSGDKNSAAVPAKKTGEVSILKEKILELQNKSDLGFGKVVPCKSVEGYGIYSPLEAGQPSSKVIFYVEPANYGVLKSDDRYIIDCAVDLFIYDTSGKLITGNENARKINKVSRSPILDLYFTVELNMTKTVKQGAFIVKMVLNDRIKNKSASSSHKIQLGAVSKKQGDSI